MSFGFSIGDFITTIELANKIRKEFVDAPSQFKDISDEVRSLSIVLQDVEVVLPERELTSQQKTELHSIADGCHNVLHKLQKTLEKYRELGSGPESVSNRVKRVWKRLKWEPEDICELRGRICSNTILLNAFNGQLTRDNVIKLVRHQDDQERRVIIDWLTPVGYSTQQSDFIGRRQEGTGQWLLNSDEFHSWLNKSRQTLFCPGIPGAGKTMITSIVIDHLWTEFQNDVNIGIAYLYCNYRQQQEQKAEDLISSLIKQLAQEQLSVPADIRNLYKRHRTKRTRPSFDEIVKVLQSTIGLYSRVFIIIDALDECHMSNAGCNRLLSAVFSLQTQTLLNLFATSRFVPEITSQFDGCISKEIRAKDDDILRYVNGRMPQLLRSRISKYPDLQSAIRREIVKAVDGMFLLAQLHLDSLLSKSTPGAIRLALQDLPRGSKGLDTMYEQAMKRINGQEEDFQELAKQVLSWVTHAERPLTTAELRHALAVGDGAVELDEDFVPEVEDLVSVCAGLVTVDEQSNIIRWIHYTTQEYFKRTWELWFPHAQMDIASVCLNYLSFDVFEPGFCPTAEEFEQRLQLNPLYDYAARNWGRHAQTGSAGVQQLILKFLESETKVSASSQALKKSWIHPDYNEGVPSQMTGIHLAAYFGLSEAMIALLTNEYDPDVKDIYDRTPLSLAAEYGHEEVVTLLLATDGVDPNSKDSDNSTPLSIAARNGHEAVVRQLLATDGVDLNSKDNDNWTPLFIAAKNGHEAVVRQLLATDGVNPNSKDSENWTPLFAAAGNGHEAVVRQLLATDGVDPDFKDSYDWTPLFAAAGNGHEMIVKLLLATDGVEPDSKNSEGRTPLWWAARNGREAVVKLLLATDGVNPNSKDSENWTPLFAAAGNGHEAVVRQLLATDGVDPDFKDSYDWTPLFAAAGNGHEAVVRLLLATDGVDPDSKNSEGRTPLWWATRNGHEAVVKLLLATDDVNPDSKNSDGRTPLWSAAENGHKAIVRQLLATNGVNPDSKDNDGLTPLWSAADNGHKAIVRRLLATDGVDPDSKNIYGRTPLWSAAENGHEAVVKLLLATDGVNPDSKNIHGRTPLWWAARNGHEAVVKLLLATDGVDPGSKDNYGLTPLFWAARNGHEAVIELLQPNDNVSS